KSLYAEVIAQVALRTVHELYEADRREHVETVVYNGMVESIDKRTGTPARVCVISFRTTRDTFEELNLDHVDPGECLKGLNAGVSKKPEELAPVRPVVEFKMVDDRFTDESDVLSELDQRPNLMQLTPSEFESLITNLFEKMGLETRQTRPSRDGGVDCVAWMPDQ
ncbi:MAG TPA: restriction endonuclease, partial [Propionibacteriaceae bacterium]|nr:restriction endonuclease [Propionibacteriaceae bacterium]